MRWGVSSKLAAHLDPAPDLFLASLFQVTASSSSAIHIITVIWYHTISFSITIIISILQFIRALIWILSAVAKLGCSWSNPACIKDNIWSRNIIPSKLWYYDKVWSLISVHHKSLSFMINFTLPNTRFDVKEISKVRCCNKSWSPRSARHISLSLLALSLSLQPLRRDLLKKSNLESN